MLKKRKGATLLKISYPLSPEKSRGFLIWFIFVGGDLEFLKVCIRSDFYIFYA